MLYSSNSIPVTIVVLQETRDLIPPFLVRFVKIHAGEGQRFINVALHVFFGEVSHG
jgi:hypothetical protein